MASASVIWIFQTHLLSLIGLVGFGFGLAAGFPVVLGYVGKMYKELTGTAFSLVITIALIGNVLSNHLMGWVSQYFGIGFYPVLLMLLVLVMGGLILGLRRKLNQF
jgi:MFS family permease